MTGLLILFALLLTGDDPLTVRFIGNEAFEITDGKRTLLTDFPYRSGAFGYMTYERSAVKPEGEVLLLITHSHLDHFDPAIAREKHWSILAPSEITENLNDRNILPPDSLVDFHGVRIFPRRTPHSGLEHYSYLVEWNGQRLYFAGDTENPSDLLAQKSLDLAFVTPWLYAAAQGTGKPIDARQIVIYHHRRGEQVDGCGSCWIPSQGDARTFGAD